MDGSVKCSVTNIIEIFCDVEWFNNNNKAPVKMRGATSGNIIVPSAQGWLQVQANTKQGYIDVLCFYSSHFTFTLLSDRDVL